MEILELANIGTKKGVLAIPYADKSEACIKYLVCNQGMVRQDGVIRRGEVTFFAYLSGTCKETSCLDLLPPSAMIAISSVLEATGFFMKYSITITEKLGQDMSCDFYWTGSASVGQAGGGWRTLQYGKTTKFLSVI